MMRAQIDMKQSTRDRIVTSVVKGEGKDPKVSRFKNIMAKCQKEEDRTHKSKRENSLDEKLRHLKRKYDGYMAGDWLLQPLPP